jgi:hypothetical protein
MSKQVLPFSIGVPLLKSLHATLLAISTRNVAPWLLEGMPAVQDDTRDGERHTFEPAAGMAGAELRSIARGGPAGTCLPTTLG